MGAMPPDADRPRVLVLTPDFPPAKGGIQLVMHQHVRHLTRIRPRVVTLDAHGGRAFDTHEQLEVRRAWAHERMPKLGIALLNLCAVREAIGSRPNVVLSGHIVTAPASVAVRAALGVPFIQYVHAAEVYDRPRLTSWALRRAEGCVVGGRYARDLAISFGADPSHVHTIPPGVSAPTSSETNRSGRPQLITVARLAERRKGHDTVIRALPLISERVPGVQWLVVGDGPLRPELEEMAAREGVADKVRFLGAVPDEERDSRLGSADVFVLVSRERAGGAGEGFGIVYLEASASGLPVVAGNVGGSLDAVVDGETGVLVDPTDHVAVANAVCDLLLDVRRAEALGRAGARRAQSFSWPRATEQLERVLLSVADGPPD
jgi:phosphatidylinositol alpha-1,6-mannosyltransferase